MYSYSVNPQWSSVICILTADTSAGFPGLKLALSADFAPSLAI